MDYCLGNHNSNYIVDEIRYKRVLVVFWLEMKHCSSYCSREYNYNTL